MLTDSGRFSPTLTRSKPSTAHAKAARMTSCRLPAGGRPMATTNGCRGSPTVPKSVGRPLMISANGHDERSAPSHPANRRSCARRRDRNAPSRTPTASATTHRGRSRCAAQRAGKLGAQRSAHEPNPERSAWPIREVQARRPRTVARTASIVSRSTLVRCDCCGSTIGAIDADQLLTRGTGGVVTVVCSVCQEQGRLPTVARRLQRQPTERAIPPGRPGY